MEGSNRPDSDPQDPVPWRPLDGRGPMRGRPPQAQAERTAWRDGGMMAREHARHRNCCAPLHGQPFANERRRVRAARRGEGQASPSSICTGLATWIAGAKTCAPSPQKFFFPPRLVDPAAHHGIMGRTCGRPRFTLGLRQHAGRRPRSPVPSMHAFRNPRATAGACHRRSRTSGLAHPSASAYPAGTAKRNGEAGFAARPASRGVDAAVWKKPRGPDSVEGCDGGGRMRHPGSRMATKPSGTLACPAGQNRGRCRLTLTLRET
jgi:hypothetical protein